MVSEDDAVITYHTDEFRARYIGSYCVKKITINSEYRSLPPLPINNECRINLSQVKETVLCVLSTASSLPMTDVFKKISRQLTLLFLFFEKMNQSFLFFAISDRITRATQLN